MKTSVKSLIIFTLGVVLVFTPSVLRCQTTEIDNLKMNRICIQTGLFHYFFDNSPILNINYRKFGGKPRPGVFSQLLINSIGIQFNRIINKKSSLSFEIMGFSNTYWKHSQTYPLIKALTLYRTFATFNVNYSRIKNISKKFDFIYGGGINYRHGYESIIVARHPIAFWQGEWVYEILADGSYKRDFGLNSFVGIDYSPLKWLTLYTKVDFMTLVYINDKKAIKKFREYYNHVPSHFPSRYDLSFRLGLGFNF